MQLTPTPEAAGCRGVPARMLDYAHAVGAAQHAWRLRCCLTLPGAPRSLGTACSTSAPAANVATMRGSAAGAMLRAQLSLASNGSSTPTRYPLAQRRCVQRPAHVLARTPLAARGRPVGPSNGLDRRAAGKGAGCGLSTKKWGFPRSPNFPGSSTGAVWHAWLLHGQYCGVTESAPELRDAAPVVDRAAECGQEGRQQLGQRLAVGGPRAGGRVALQGLRSASRCRRCIGTLSLRATCWYALHNGHGRACQQHTAVLSSITPCALSAPAADLHRLRRRFPYKRASSTRC